MVINPGEISLELLLGENPLYYMLFVYAGAVVLAGIASWWADRQADNALKADARETDPMADTTQVYEFENVRDPVIAGVLVCVVVVFPMASSIDTIGGWQGVYASAVLAGITARMILKSLAAKFAAKVTKQ